MIIRLPDIRNSSFSNISKWIDYYRLPQININNYYNEFSIIIKNTEVKIYPEEINSYISAGDSIINFLPKNKDFPNNITRELNKELIVFYDGIFYLLNRYFGKIRKTVSDNKIIDLINARKCGLSVPDTIITNSKNELLKFFNIYKGNKIITKSLGGLLRFDLDTEILWGKGTIIVDINGIDSCSKMLFPSIFQKYIKKQYEIRTFYFKGEFYSMAIFSQNDTKTLIDFRNYNREKPNRMVPFKLPEEIESKIDKFMKISDLDTGSIDLIATRDEKEFVFLEVNPFGQFGWLSSNTNYYIEKRIAKYFEEYEN